MSENDSGTAVGIDSLETGDDVTVEVNGRAAGHLGAHSIPATVIDRVMCDARFETDDGTTFTVHGDTGYIIGHHDGLGRSSDIGRVRRVLR